MRFAMFIIPPGYETAAPDAMPDAGSVAAMSRYNEELRKAGVLISLEGLFPPATGARVSFSGRSPEVSHGPFPGVREAVGGFWIIRANSQEEAVDWARRCPAGADAVIEIRRIQEFEDFPADVRAVLEEREGQLTRG